MANKMIFMAAILKHKMAAITIFQNGCQQTFSKNKMASQSRGLPCVKIQIAISKLAIWKKKLVVQESSFSFLACHFVFKMAAFHSLKVFLQILERVSLMILKKPEIQHSQQIFSGNHLYEVYKYYFQ